MNKTTLPEKKSKQAKSSTLDKQTTYHIDGRSFIVQPVFKDPPIISYLQFASIHGPRN